MDDAHDVVAAYWAAAEARDWGTFAGLLAEQVVYEGPDFWPGRCELPASRAHLVERY